MNLFTALFGFAPGIRIVYRFGVELTERDFIELTPEQYDAYRRKVGPTTERIYRIAIVEPTAIERTSEKVTWELEIVTEQEKLCLLAAVGFIRKCSKELDGQNPSFADRLEFLRQRLPPELTGARK